MPTPPPIYLATGNAHKVEEFNRLARRLPGELVFAHADEIGGMPAVRETGETFAANARLKAVALHAQAQGKVWVMADDSGLEVDALGGLPGVHSARFAGEDATDFENMDMLLTEMENVPPTYRSARFRCYLCLLGPESVDVRFEGTCEGSILVQMGPTGGFGYDPLFVPAGYTESLGVLGPEVKDAVSHRSRALHELSVWWQERFAGIGENA